MSVPGFSLSQSRSLFFILLSVISAAVLGYAAAFFFLEARLAALSMTVGVLVLTPLAIFLELKSYANAARMVLLAEGIGSIFSTHLGVRAPLHADLYYLAAMTLPLLIFEAKNKKSIWGAVSISAIMWTVQQRVPMPEFSSYWVPHEFPIQPFQTLNFIGTAISLTIFLNLYLNLSAQIQQQLDSTNQRLNEAQRIAKMGSWS